MTTLPPLNCAGCRTCCLGDTVKLVPGDNPKLYKKKRGPDGVYVLAKGKDGNCVYLGKRGCEIQTTKPYECRRLDCRKYALEVDAREPAHKAETLANPRRRAVVEEGRRRLSPAD